MSKGEAQREAKKMLKKIDIGDNADGEVCSTEFRTFVCGQIDADCLAESEVFGDDDEGSSDGDSSDGDSDDDSDEDSDDDSA